MHRGDRNYYEFSLWRASATPVSTISMQLKKVNPKKNKFTLNVVADDRTIERGCPGSAPAVLYRTRPRSV